MTSNTVLPMYLEAQDVDQEMEILRWQGITPRRAFVEHRLSNLGRKEVPFCMLAWEGRDSDSLQDFEPSVSEMPWSMGSPRCPEALEKMVAWASTQSGPVQEAIQQFLNDPDAEGAVENTIKILKKLRNNNHLLSTEMPKTPAAKPGEKPGTLTALIYRHLPSTKEDLVSMIRRESLGTKRPEATVRQFIRRATAEGKITIVDGMIHGKSS